MLDRMRWQARVLALLVAASTIAAKAFAFHPSLLASRRPTSACYSVPNALDTLTSGLASICRLPNGITVNDNAVINDKSIQLLRLYDVENSRECRAVRELITELDLVIDCVIPAAPNSKARTDSSYKYALPSGASVPCLVLSQRGETTTLSGVDAIGTFLRNEFGMSESAGVAVDTKEQVIATLNELGSYVASVFRAGRGTRVSPAANQPPLPNEYQPLVLYSYEGNQFCRLVREVLTELDLPYELRNAGKQSTRRTELAGITGGSTRCPFLIDPNTKTQLSDSADIIRYLYQQYAQWTPPSELLQWASETILPLAKPVFAMLAPAQAGAYSEDSEAYNQEIATAMAEIEAAIRASPVVVYTYGLSPFSSECKALLDSLSIAYTEMSLGQEWIPGLIRPGGAATRAALLKMTGQSSLPHIFVGGKSIGGLFSGTPGLLPALEAGTLKKMVEEATPVSMVA